jgi:threonyl-tRNA synthetase
MSTATKSPSARFTACCACTTSPQDICRQVSLEDMHVKLSTRPDNCMGDEATWDVLERALILALEGVVLNSPLKPSERAFCSPKLVFVLRASVGLDSQCGTPRADMNLPERFGVEFVDKDGHRKRLAMLYHALFGLLALYTGIVIEHQAGKLPARLAPVHAIILAQLLRGARRRAGAHMRNEKIGYKVREQTLQRVPLLLVVGTTNERDSDSDTIAIRIREVRDPGMLTLKHDVTWTLQQTQAPDVAERGAVQKSLYARLTALDIAAVPATAHPEATS